MTLPAPPVFTLGDPNIYFVPAVKLYLFTCTHCGSRLYTKKDNLENCRNCGAPIALAQYAEV